MAFFDLVRWTVTICVLCQAASMATCAQETVQPVQRSADLQQQLNEIQALQIRINDRLSQMNALANLSAHGPLDPAVNLMTVEITQLERLLAKQAAQLEQRYAEMRKADIESALQAHEIQVAGDAGKPSFGELLRQRAAGPWRQVELGGRQYYLVPVEEIDDPAAAVKGKPKIITPSTRQPQR